MKRRAGEAAAGGDSGWRMICCCWVASGSASASAASASAPEKGRRSATPLIYILFLPLRPSSSLLLTHRRKFAGTPLNSSKPSKQTRMASAWKFAKSDLKGEAALKLLKAGRPPVLALVKDYCLGMPVIDTFTVPGALPQAQNNGSTVLEEKSLLTQPAQEFIRAVLLLLESLFEAGYVLDGVDDTTMLFDICTGSVLLSIEATEQKVIPIGSQVALVDETIASVAVKLEEWLFTQNNYSLAELPEVTHGLFALMANKGNDNWYAIVNNMALVPLENRREVFIRMYEQLVDVVQKRSKTDYQGILRELDFPMNWHHAIGPEVNGIMFRLYGGAIYRATASTQEEQAEEITRLFRNSGVHVFQKLWYRIGRSDVMLVLYALAPLLLVSLQAALQKRNWLVSTEIHTLLVYSKQAYT